ncbi:MAG: PQQ-dependent sugar dehydrogenase [Rhodopila sp.]
MKPIVPLLVVAVLGTACDPVATLAQRPAVGQSTRNLRTEDGMIRVDVIARGLDHPWCLAFLPDGRMLVTERPGQLRVITRDGRASAPVQNVPTVYAHGQGGLLDVALDPDFTVNRLVYLSYAEPGPNDTASTAVARGQLNQAATALDNVTVIFRQEPKVPGGNHFGSRLAFAPDGMLFISTGERFKFEPAQDLSNDLGKIVRIKRDGSIPPDNPFVGKPGARPEIWSYGHRNVQGIAIDPRTGLLWADEFGPRGGDELNIPQAGHNYGWPLVSAGKHYDGRLIPDPSTRPDLAAAVYQWTPVISPSGMVFYTSNLFPGWRGDILIGGLSAQGIVRVTLDGNRVRGEHRIEVGQRIRDVAQGPDGAVYALTDQTDGEILRLSPAHSKD